MRDKLLSIIIPSYNAGKYIAECLKSINKLPLRSIEIVVINDGSKDNTAAIVEECSRSDDRIRLYNLENGGVSRARNEGIERANGEYLMFLDADDLLLTEAFDLLIENIKSDSYDFTAFSRDILEENGRIWKQPFNNNGNEISDKAAVDQIMYADSLLNECWGKLFKRSIIDEYSIRFPVDVPIGEDLMFVMNYYSHCKKVHVYNTSLVLYRQHGGSAMRRYNISDRMGYTEMLFDYSKKYLPDDMMSMVFFYNFKILTNLCREYAKSGINSEAVRVVYNSDMTNEVMSELDISSIPLYRKHEYILMKNKMFRLSAIYYFFKTILSKVN